MKLEVDIAEGSGLVHRRCRMPLPAQGRVADALQTTVRAAEIWSARRPDERTAIMKRLSAQLSERRLELAILVTRETGKPITMAEAEIDRTALLVEKAIAPSLEPLDHAVEEGIIVRRRPVGLIAVITAWNNPVAIPLGKIVPALLFGNVVAWKPSPNAGETASALLEMFTRAGLPEGSLVMIPGGDGASAALMEDPRVDAVTLTGSPAAGRTAQAICTRRMVRLQLELGGNNAAIVWRDCDLDHAAAEVANGAFAFAGQRCTANRRVIVDSACYESFVTRLLSATRALAWGDPFSPATRVGPLVSESSARRVWGLLAHAASDGHRLYAPHEQSAAGRGGAWLPPTIVCCDDPWHEIVQQETFGPVLVVQRADDWDHAMQLCNGVREGLVAALFSHSRELQDRFLAGAQAGVLKLNRSTSDASASAPFGGWKQSGFGPPEHGECNREFYTRIQTIYR